MDRLLSHKKKDYKVSRGLAIILIKELRNIIKKRVGRTTGSKEKILETFNKLFQGVKNKNDTHWYVPKQYLNNKEMLKKFKKIRVEYARVGKRQRGRKTDEMRKKIEKRKDEILEDYDDDLRDLIKGTKSKPKKKEELKKDKKIKPSKIKQPTKFKLMKKIRKKKEEKYKCKMCKKY